jgi:hypothetical protein
VVIVNLPVLVKDANGNTVERVASLNPMLIATAAVVGVHAANPARSTIYLPGGVVLEAKASRLQVLEGVGNLLKRVGVQHALTDGLGEPRGQG